MAPPRLEIEAWCPALLLAPVLAVVLDVVSLVLSSAPLLLSMKVAMAGMVLSLEPALLLG
jgi:hypothetical protein